MSWMFPPFERPLVLFAGVLRADVDRVVRLAALRVVALRAAGLRAAVRDETLREAAGLRDDAVFEADARFAAGRADAFAVRDLAEADFAPERAGLRVRLAALRLDALRAEADRLAPGRARFVRDVRERDDVEAFRDDAFFFAGRFALTFSPTFSPIC